MPITVLCCEAIHPNSGSRTPSATGSNTPASGWVCLPSSSRGNPESPFRPSDNGDGGRAAIDTQEGRRSGHVSLLDMSQLLGGCTQGVTGSLEAARACPIQSGFPTTTPPEHPTGECHSGRNLHSGVSVPCRSTTYWEALHQQFVIDTPRPLTEPTDFLRRRATLLDFSPELREEDSLFSLWNDV